MPNTASDDAPRRRDPDGPATPTRVPIPKAPDDDPTPVAAARHASTRHDDTFVFAPGLAPFDLPPFDEAYAMGRADDAYAKGSDTGALQASREAPTHAPPACEAADDWPRDDATEALSRADQWFDEDELLEILGPAQANYGGAI